MRLMIIQVLVRFFIYFIMLFFEDSVKWKYSLFNFFNGIFIAQLILNFLFFSIILQVLKILFSDNSIVILMNKKKYMLL